MRCQLLCYSTRVKRSAPLLQILSSATAVVVTFCLLVSFGLHSVQVTHEHPSHAHTDTALAHHHADQPESKLAVHDQFHKSDEKLFLFIILSLIAFGFCARPNFLNASWQQCVVHICRAVTTLMWRLFYFEQCSYLERLFRCGILHPKLF